MDPISNVDALVLVLRQRLEERARAQSAMMAGAPKTAGKLRERDVRSVEALAALEGVSDHQLGRALIQTVLTDRFGADLLNEAKFQRVVDQVTQTLEQEPQVAGLLSQALKELHAAVR